jgi:hypothetical protein
MRYDKLVKNRGGLSERNTNRYVSKSKRAGLGPLRWLGVWRMPIPNVTMLLWASLSLNKRIDL